MSTQVNVRMEQELLDEIDLISEVLHISRTEWLRMKIALAAKEDSINLREAIALEYARGHITEKGLRDSLGKDAEDIIFIVENMRDGKRYVEGIAKKGRK